jgi:hypothetical protein
MAVWPSGSVTGVSTSRMVLSGGAPGTLAGGL